MHLKGKLEDKPAHLKTRLADAMRAENLDAVIAMSPENFLHLAGVFVASQRLIRERLAIAIYTATGDPFLVVSSVVANTVGRESWVGDVVVWTEHETTPIQSLASELHRRGLDHGHLGIEKQYLAAQFFEDLIASTSDVSWSDCETILNRSRMVKTPNEIELMRHNAIAAERAIWAGFMYTIEGTTEKQIADRMRTSLYELGGDYSPFMSLAAGKHSGEHHAVPGDYQVQHGDILAVDMVGLFRGYYSDYARMAVAGKASSLQRKVWQAVIDIQRQVMQDAVPGVTAETLAINAERYAVETGYPLDINLVGHSLGIGLHEYPPLTKGCTEPLVENMTMCIEILVQEPDQGRFHVEDLVHVAHPGGAKRLTTYFDTSELYEIHL
jgi:Xaa-Pro dipeptidase